MEETLRALVAVGLGGLLVMLRFDAERFGAAEYDEVVDGVRPPLRRRLAWYVVGVSLILAIVFIHPDPEGQLGLALGDRTTALLAGFAYGAAGITQAHAFTFLRYRPIRYPNHATNPSSAGSSSGSSCCWASSRGWRSSSRHSCMPWRRGPGLPAGSHTCSLWRSGSASSAAG
jgi:hypothetical protein